MNLSYKPQGHGQFIQAPQSIFHCTDVVNYFFNFGGEALPCGVCLVFKYIGKGGLSSFDL